MRRVKVYIASPYTIGDQNKNVRQQIDMADELMTLGYAPYAPLPTTHAQHFVHPRHYDEWISIDLEWVAVCDVVLRLPGESKGADIEAKFAHDNAIPVVGSLAELEKWRMHHKL